MATVGDQIIDALVAALKGEGKPAGLRVDRARVRAWDPAQLPATGVFKLRDTAQRVTLETVEHEMNVRLAHRAIAPEGTPADAAVDPLYAWGVQALMADITAGGLALRIDEASTEFGASEQDEQFAMANSDFTVVFHTTEDPEVAR